MKTRKPKQPEMVILKSQIHYWQMQRRIELRWARMSEKKIREIATRMRALQQAGK